ncbi:UNVERIFIED_CONTAM: hypothetical protein Sradi_0219400 [Sesamum radiatum]|uniref:Myb/SANT-like domain-containing protein n=1 Tax=Sesamum radiatum TaxID=300843 RepID=A0AAW2VZS1_SESRA
MCYDQAMTRLKQPLRRDCNEDSLVYAAAAVNVFARRQWSLGYFKDKLRMLQLRYETFRLVLEEPTLHWNENTNRVQGRREDWRNFVWQNPFAKAYRYYGEPKWGLLQQIFDVDVDWNKDGDEETPTIGADRRVEEASDHESDVIFLGSNEDEKPEVVDLLSSDSDD